MEMSMPTGYTAAIKDGISFEKFVWSCARAFGALVTMRDDPMDAPIPQAFESSTYNAQALAKARAELTRLQAMMKREISAACAADYEQQMKRHGEWLTEKAQLREKYTAMLAKVQAWAPPTPDHAGMKDFMVKQITESISFDCSISHMRPPQKLSPEEWHAARVQSAQADAEYHEKAQAEEDERTAQRNAWLAALRESVPPAP
jgi:hypothetical protein